MFQLRSIPAPGAGCALLLPLLFIAAGSAAAQPVLDPSSARAVFNQARDIAERDDGLTWGRSLDGPILLVRPDDRLTYANLPIPGFRKDGTVWTGSLPDTIGVANTAVSFADTSWTMLMWPLPTDEVDRRALIAHELWHRVQEDIGFPMTDAATLHLGSRDARFWLRAEWRALSAALLAADDATRDVAIRDALAFLSARRGLYPAAEFTETALLMNEGLAEYTGWHLAGPTPREARERAAARLARAEQADTFVRTFAYFSGPAWGLLLDAVYPDWREWADPGTDFATIMMMRPEFSDIDASTMADSRLDRYGGSELAAEENRLELERAERRRAQRIRYVEGPILRLDFHRMSVSFDPGTVDVLDDLGRIYGSMQIRDEWGILRVSGGGLIQTDWSAVVVPAPPDVTARPLAGDGWSLDLADGWTLQPGKRGGDWIVVPENP